MAIVSAVDFLQVKCRLSILCTNPYLRINLYEKNDTANVIAAVILMLYSLNISSSPL